MLSAILVTAALTAAPQSKEGLGLVAAVQASLDQARARQSKLPPARDDAERIIRLGELDQAPRMVLGAFDWSRIPAEDRDAAFRAEGVILDASHRELQAALLRLLPPEGWFLKSRYGAGAAKAAFLIVQHSDLKTQRRFLPRLEALAKKGEVEGEFVAGMSDRVAISEDRPQRFGTQFRCDGGKWRPYPLQDAAKVEQFRRQFGVRMTFAETKSFFQALPPCPQTPTPPPRGMKLD